MQSVLMYIVFFVYRWRGTRSRRVADGENAVMKRKSTIIAFPRYRFLKIVSESATLVDERGVDK